MRRCIISIVSGLFFLGIVQFQALAQSSSDDQGSSGSFYSFYGIGIPVDITNVEEKGLGTFGVSLERPEASGLQNPALWGRNAFTTATSGFSIERYNVKDQSLSAVNSIFNANYFQVVFPLLQQKLGMSFSVYPETRSNYRILYTQSVEVPGSEELTFDVDSRGSGGVSKLELGLGWNINKYISVGYAPSYSFITYRKIDNFIFDSESFSNSNISNRISGSSFSHRFGMLLSFTDLLRNNDRLSIGTTYTLPLDIEANRELTSDRNIAGDLEEVLLGEGATGNVRIPQELVYGLTYYPSRFFNVSLEGKTQSWSEFEYDVNPEDETYMVDLTKIGLGAQFHPYKHGSNKFLSNFRYSAGITYDSGHLKINNEQIKTFWLSTGLGIISKRSRSSVDLSLSYGIRGTTTNNLVQENIWSFNISVNLAELMFRRPKLN